MWKVLASSTITKVTQLLAQNISENRAVSLKIENSSEALIGVTFTMKPKDNTNSIDLGKKKRLTSCKMFLPVNLSLKLEAVLFSDTNGVALK